MKQWIKKNLITVLLFCIMFAGIVLIIYPSAANWWNSFHQTSNVASYVSAVASMDHTKYDRILEEAVAYNEKIAETGVDLHLNEEELSVYNQTLNVSGSGIMGYIDIPEIHVTLPIYHSTEDIVLEIAIGHLAGTSLPVGGESSHCVVSGHRGLPSAKLFTDIDKLEVGDTWTLNVLDQTLTYEVDQIRVIEPSNLRNLQIVEGEDYCTLVTCTPYGINTHRLLVRGHRIPNVQGNARVTADALQIDTKFVAPFVASPILIVLLILLLVTTRKRK